MKTCPQCNLAYQDDYLFCLTDGNTLLDESGEQETLLANRIVFADMEQAEAPTSQVSCRKCENENRANSKFCKKCGSPLVEPDVFVESAPGAVDPQFEFRTTYDETRAFQPLAFTRPSAGEPHYRAVGKKNQTYFLIAALVLGAVIVAGAVVYSSQPSGNKSVSDTSTSSNNKTTLNKTAERPTSSDQNTVAVSSLIGRKGMLTTNQRIRADSHKNAEIMGVHYQGARVEILQEKSYNTEDGTYATWYRVRVLTNGCDQVSGLGCGNDRDGLSGQAANEGWMNAKYISLD